MFNLFFCCNFRIFINVFRSSLAESKGGNESYVAITQENQATTLDLSKKGLKKVPKQDDAQNIKILILDDNDLQKIDNIDSYLRIEKVIPTTPIYNSKGHFDVYFLSVF